MPPRTVILSPNRDAYSETFIRAYKQLLQALRCLRHGLETTGDLALYAH